MAVSLSVALSPGRRGVHYARIGFPASSHVCTGQSIYFVIRGAKETFPANKSTTFHRGFLFLFYFATDIFATRICHGRCGIWRFAHHNNDLLLVVDRFSSLPNTRGPYTRRTTYRQHLASALQTLCTSLIFFYGRSGGKAEEQHLRPRAKQSPHRPHLTCLPLVQMDSLSM